MLQLPASGAIPDAAEVVVVEPELLVPVESAPDAEFVLVDVDVDDEDVSVVDAEPVAAASRLVAPDDVAVAPTPVEMVVVSCEAAVGLVATTVMPSAAVESADE